MKHACMVAVLAAFPLFCPAQDKPTAIPLLPAANWVQIDSHSLPLSAIGNYGGESAVEAEYGVKTLELRTYELKKRQIQVLVERAEDVTSAYGLLTFYQTETMSPEKTIQMTVGDDNQSLMLRGSNFIRFLRRNDKTISDPDFEALLVFVGGDKLSANTVREMPRPLPEKGLLPGSEKYLLGLETAKRVLPSFRMDLIGFDQGAEVQVGQYHTATGASTVLSISYPTPQIARIRFGSLSSLLGLNQDHGGDSVFGKRNGSYVFLVLNAGSKEVASSVMEQFQVSDSISWDQKYQTERGFTLELVHMILSILLLTAILLGVCVVAGVGFFLSKRLAAKYFPQSQWGRTDQDQLIRLDLKN